MTISSYNRPPKGQETAFQRWEMGAFEEEVARRRAVLPDETDFSDGKPKLLFPIQEPDAVLTAHPGLKVTQVEPEEVVVISEPTVSQATVEDVRALIEDMRREAQEAGYRVGFDEGQVRGHQEGYEQGLESGYSAGLDKGAEEGRIKGEAEGFEKGYGEGTLAGEEYATTLRALLKSFAKDVQVANEAVAEDLLALGLDFAKAMLRSAFKVRPELVVPIVADAVRSLPSLQQPAILYLNSEDAKIVIKAMGEELEEAGWRIVEEAVERGNCRIETGTNQIDSSLATRWERLAARLGRDSAWMD